MSGVELVKDTSEHRTELICICPEEVLNSDPIHWLRDCVTRFVRTFGEGSQTTAAQQGTYNNYDRFTRLTQLQKSLE